MADIELIVKISENRYRRIKEDWHHESDAWDSYEAIRNSTPLTESDDCVSRQAVLDIFGDIHPLDYNTNAYVSQIKKLPSVQPKRDKGEWIPIDTYESVDNMDLCKIIVTRWKCSNCGEIKNIHSGNFCPNCGAEMR